MVVVTGQLEKLNPIAFSPVHSVGGGGDINSPLFDILGGSISLSPMLNRTKRECKAGSTAKG